MPSSDSLVQAVTLCECGCGLPTPIAKQTRTSRGWINGEPTRFRLNHWTTKFALRGAKHPAWKNGRKQAGGGYVSILLPDHQSATKTGYVLEHILISERALGRPLPLKAEIHHVNEIPFDNRNANLVICESLAYHKLLHQRLRAVKAGVPAHWLKCPYCKRYDKPEALWIGPRHGKHHRACSQKYKRDRRIILAEESLAVVRAERTASMSHLTEEP